MNEHDLIQLSQQPEGERIEWKAVFYPLKDRIQQTICAFANDLHNSDQPGVIFIGRKDDGNCEHLTIDDQLQRDAADIRNLKISPPIDLEVQPVTIDGCPLLALIVQPSVTAPVWYNNKIYVRIGSTTRQSTVTEERELRQKTGNRPYDSQIVSRQATWDDLNHTYIQDKIIRQAISSDILEENDRPLQHQADVLGLTDPREHRPTVAGILIAGKTPRYFIPGAYIQFRRVDGNTLDDPTLDHAEIDGTLAEMIEKIEQRFSAHNRVALQSGAIAQDIPDYPPKALEELIRNALIHRDYESTNAPVRVTWYNDFIEIHNPGGPFGRVTEQNFGEPNVTDYRNSTLARLAKSLGFVQRFGVGIKTARTHLQQNANPAPQFEVAAVGHGNFVLAKIYRRPQ